MGRATEFFDYINQDYEPDAEYKQRYCSLNTDDYKKLRQKLARERKKRNLN